MDGCSEPQAAERLKKGLILFHQSTRWRQRKTRCACGFRRAISEQNDRTARRALSRFRARPNRKPQALFDNQCRKPCAAACLECRRGERLTLKALPDVPESRPPCQRHKEK